MRHLRRHNMSARIEMVPLIDVIFLLLTFFIYSLVTMVQIELLPVTLRSLVMGQSAQPVSVAAVTIDRLGRLYLDRQPVDEAELFTRLHDMAESDNPPSLFLAMEEPSDDEPLGPAVDRGPMLISLIELVKRAGIADFNIVGQPAAQ